MKALRTAALFALLAIVGGAAFGQYRPPVRNNTLFRTVFRQAWTMSLPGPVKLIEVGQVLDQKRNSFVMLVGGADVSDYRRRLLVTHWAGGQFVTDEAKEFAGAAIDSLLVGRFRQEATNDSNDSIPAPVAPSGTAHKGKSPKATPPKRKASGSPAQQIVTTEGIYAMKDGHLTRLFTAPPNARLAMLLQNPPDLVVGGQGNLAQAYVMADTQADIFPGSPPKVGDGYVRFGVGTQDFEGAEDLKMALGVRFVQSYWNSRDRWMIGIVRPQNTAASNTFADRLAVLTPRSGKSDLDFWAAKPADFEETWRSDPFPGRILDVRVGDPRNEGKEGLLVLTSENNDRERHLYCFRPAQVIAGQ